MAFNLYEGYLVGRGRRADAIRDAERRRLVKSVEDRGDSPGRLQRLGLSLGRLAPVHLDAAAAEPRPRETVATPMV